MFHPLQVVPALLSRRFQSTRSTQLAAKDIYKLDVLEQEDNEKREDRRIREKEHER
jgi:hypothetical protein